MNIHKTLFIANLFIIFYCKFLPPLPLPFVTPDAISISIKLPHAVSLYAKKSARAHACTRIQFHLNHDTCTRITKTTLAHTNGIVFRVHLIFLFAVKIICIYILICSIVQSKWNFTQFSCQFVFISSCQLESEQERQTGDGMNKKLRINSKWIWLIVTWNG